MTPQHPFLHAFAGSFHSCGHVTMCAVKSVQVTCNSAASALPTCCVMLPKRNGPHIRLPKKKYKFSGSERQHNNLPLAARSREMRNLAQRAQSTQTPTEKATALCLPLLMYRAPRMPLECRSNQQPCRRLVKSEKSCCAHVTPHALTSTRVLQHSRSGGASFKNIVK